MNVLLEGKKQNYTSFQGACWKLISLTPWLFVVSEPVGEVSQP